MCGRESRWELARDDVFLRNGYVAGPPEETTWDDKHPKLVIETASYEYSGSRERLYV